MPGCLAAVVHSGAGREKHSTGVLESQLSSNYILYIHPSMEGSQVMTYLINPND